MVHGYLRNFYNATFHFCSNKYPNFNIFPKVCRKRLKMIEWKDSKYDFVRTMMDPMKEKFDKYWN